MKQRHPYVYGPVPSRRFGLSLGVDLLPGKVCSYDCIYCQVGRTRELTTRRREFFPPEEVLAEVSAALERAQPDVITLAGSGEPTLYRPLDRLIAGLHRLAPRIPAVLITNGSLLYDPGVAERVLLADVLVPSLDAGDEATFRRVNRPHPSVPFSRMVQGLQAAAERHPGLVRMEVMLCAGCNDSDESLRTIAARLAGMKLECIELNSPVRPVASAGVAPCSAARLEEARQLFGERAKPIGAYTGRSLSLPWAQQKKDLLALLARRPCTQEDLAAALGATGPELARLLATSLAQGLIDSEERGDEVYYRVSGR